MLSNTRREKYQLNLDIAKNVMKYNKTSALKLINSTIYKIQVAKIKLGRNTYRNLMGQAYLMKSKSQLRNLNSMSINAATQAKASVMTKKLKVIQIT